MVEDSQRGSGVEDSFEALLRQGAEPLHVGISSRLSGGSKLAGGRFEVARRLGEGGMGIVYEAFDTERRAKVALKMLSRLDANGIYRLKNEFRALADVSHPNLVPLHELFADGMQWFFTMDLVPGVRFDEWVRPGAASDEARLRAALPQLVSAVTAIHEAGKLHRDLKPSNVLVTGDGQVVVLDFGLAVDPELGGVGQTIADDSVSGTPAYMAPEQAAGQQASAASDFYAIGVMLFEALTGVLPFGGRAGEMLAAKQTGAAPSVLKSTPAAPSDLAALCAELLARDPAARPDRASLTLRVGSVAAPHSNAPPRAGVVTERETLLGREPELAQLRAAYAATLAGQPVLMFVAGESGMGKSALVATFLEALREEGSAAVLAGRCYERESLPFKGFDSLVDDLSRFLRRSAHADASALMPREVFALARLFPVLDRVDAVASAPKKDVPDSQELRRRAFAAFGELMARLRDRRPLVLYIDDAQWLDHDSVAFLRALIVQPQPVPALVLLSHRSEGAQHNPFLQSVLDAARGNSLLELRSLALGPLAASAAQALAERWFGAVGSSLAGDVAREAGGSPFFVAELARYAARSRAHTSLSRVSLSSALAERLADLSSESRRLLEVIALAGSPLPMQFVIEAAGSSHADLDALRNAHLVRTSSGKSLETVECYHDRIRETVAAGLSASACIARYAGLALALQGRAEIDAELVARCLEGSGQPALAAEYAERAGDKAAAATAFDHAASLYDKALALGQHAKAARQALSIKLGDALAAAGRGPDAAAIYRRCAAEAERADSLDLRRRAAEQLVTCGQMSEGAELLRTTCHEVGLEIAISSRRALLSLMYTRLRLRFLNFDGLMPTQREVPEAVRLRLDCAQSAVRGLVGHAPIVAASLADDWLLEAARSGAPSDLAQALGMQLYLHSLLAPTDESRLTALARASERALDERMPAAARAFVLVATANAEVNCGRWRSGRGGATRGLDFLRSQCTGVAWEIDAAVIYEQIALGFCGQFLDIARIAPSAIEEAFRCGRLWFGALLSGYFGLPARLIHDDVRGARRQLDEALKRWVPQAEPLWVDFSLSIGEAVLALYRGEPSVAHVELGAREAGFQRSLLQYAAIFRVEFLRLRGASAVAVLRASPGTSESRRIAERCAKQLARESFAPGQPHALAIEAGLALIDGRRDRAIAHLRGAVLGLDRCDMGANAAAARRRLGQLLGGDEGAALLGAGDAALRAQGVTNLEAMTEMLFPGCKV